MTDKITVEDIGMALPDLDDNSLYLIKNKINQILFERSIAGIGHPTVIVAEDPEHPGNIKVEIPEEIERMLDEAQEELAKSFERLKASGELGD